MNLFNFNIKKYAVLLTPTFLRKELVYFISAMVEPLVYIYNYLVIARHRNLILLQHNTSKASVEALMRKTFGVGIYITQGLVENALFLSETSPRYLSTDLPIYLNTEGFYLPKITVYLSTEAPVYIGTAYLDSYQPQVDYTIHVPSALWNVYENEIKNYANLFSLPGMTFNFNIY